MKKCGSSPRAIVYGGAGFLGSHVADALTASGYAVRIFDIQASSYLKPGQEMVIGDIGDLNATCRAAQGCDIVYNFAGIADIDEANTDPVNTCRLNVSGCVHTLEAAHRAGVQHYIYASTVYVYGDSGGFYRASKQSAERFVEVYGDHHNLPYSILRYGSLYGRRSDNRNGLFRLLHGALIHNRITYPGTGEEIREYIHVEDAASLSIAILDPAFKDTHYVITGQEKMKVRDTVRMIQELVDKPVAVDFRGRMQDPHYAITPYAFKPKMGRKLVTNPFMDLGQGLLDCLSDIGERFNVERTTEVVAPTQLGSKAAGKVFQSKAAGGQR